MYSDTLFVITGDHSERFSFVKEQDIRTLSSIPCIFYGTGVQQSWFHDKSVGDHMQLAGTLAEIVGPAGFTYHCRQICLKIKTWCLITGYMLQMEKFIRKVLILIKKSLITSTVCAE